MKPGLAQIVGRTISRIVVAQATYGPGTQVVLEFEDGTSFELYGTQFSCASGVDQPGYSLGTLIEQRRPQSVIAVHRRPAGPAAPLADASARRG